MNIAIVGLGLIGGSIGRALVKRTSHVVWGADQNDEAAFKGAMLNAYHSPLTDQNAPDADVLILAVYPDGVEQNIKKYLPLMKSGSIIIDCAGVKRGVVKVMKKYAEERPDVSFIGGHPMAGREFSGISHSVVTLMDKSSMLLINVNASLEAMSVVIDLFKQLGADGAVITTAEKHDELIAYTSQLAHVVSSAYVTSPLASESYGFSAGSFRDMTRVARLNANMWTELFTENADFLSQQIGGLIERLSAFKTALDDGDDATLRNLLEKGNAEKLECESRRQSKLNEVLN